MSCKCNHDMTISDTLKWHGNKLQTQIHRNTERYSHDNHRAMYEAIRSMMDENKRLKDRLKSLAYEVTP